MIKYCKHLFYIMLIICQGKDLLGMLKLAVLVHSQKIISTNYFVIFSGLAVSLKVVETIFYILYVE